MKYELTTIVPETVTMNPAVALVAAHGGTITRDEALGVRRLAYPIKQHTNGAYTRFGLELEPAQVQPLDAALRRSADIIRHLIVLQPRENVAPAPQKVEMSDEQIAALGDVKEMQAAAAKQRVAPATERQSDRATETVQTEQQAPAEDRAIEQPSDKVIKGIEPPVEGGTTADHPAVKDESGVDEATRQAALDEKLKSILGK